MPRFFTGEIFEDRAAVMGEDARHITKSLRMRPGEQVTLCDGQGMDYHCALLSVEEERVELAVVKREESRGEPKTFVRLYQALPKGDKLELIVQKATELGVSQVVPVLTSRCVSRPDAKSMEKKLRRLEKIAIEAAKQSGRGRIPQVLPLCGFREAVKGMTASELAILFYEESREPLSSVLGEPVSTVSLFVGSEGGFSPEEAAFAREAGVAPASLGNRVLRCETAPLCALSALFFAFGEY